MDDSRAVRAIAGAGDLTEALAIARAFFRSHGFHALSYARPSREHPGRADAVTFGFPESFVARYDEELNRLDPFPALVARSGRAIRFSRLADEQALTSDHQTFLDEAREHGVTDGYIFPTFGPREHLAAIGI